MRNKAEDIAMVLKLLGEGRFEYHTFDGGTGLVFKDFVPSVTELEDFFGNELRDFYLFCDGEPIKDCWDDQATPGFIDRVFGDQSHAEREELKSQLRGKPYDEVLAAAYSKWWKSQDTGWLGRRFLDAREELSNTAMEEAEALLTQHVGDGLSDSIASGIASKLASLYPKMLRRVEKLRVLPASRDFPPKLQPYLKEATRCYEFGQFLAGTILCRSIIEFALHDFLVRAGREKDLRSIQVRDGDGLLALISLGRLIAGQEYGAILDHADEIRRRVNRALHQEPLDDQTCIDLFTKTRGVLKQLYA